ncbi:hypothetical protein TF3313_1444 [Tannerella forsythia 3313]|nr:hypothetical protein TF3313_1444 [Tannerella forsythia 3313]
MRSDDLKTKESIRFG